MDIKRYFAMEHTQNLRSCYDMACAHITSDESVYLHALRPTRGPVESRRYCDACGLVKESGGRKLGHFISGLARFDRALRKRQDLKPLTDVERRLVVKAMGSDPVLCDAYGSTLRMQVDRMHLIISEYRLVPECVLEDAFG